MSSNVSPIGEGASAPARAESLEYGGGNGGGGLERRLEKLEDKIHEVDNRVVKIEERLLHMPTKLWMVVVLLSIVGGSQPTIFNGVLSLIKKALD